MASGLEYLTQAADTAERVVDVLGMQEAALKDEAPLLKDISITTYLEMSEPSFSHPIEEPMSSKSLAVLSTMVVDATTRP